MSRRRDKSGGAAEVPRRPAYDKALGLLARREHSQRELRIKLQRSGYDRDESDIALNRLGEQHYQDDQRFAEMLVRSRIGHGYGPTRIRAELKSHGLGDAAIAAALEDSDADWTASAAAQLARRYGRKAATDFTERARRAQFLLRRGFDAATVRAVTRADVDEAADSDDP